MTVYRREVDAKYNASARAVSHPRPYARLISDLKRSFPSLPVNNQLAFQAAALFCTLDNRRTFRTTLL